MTVVPGEPALVRGSARERRLLVVLGLLSAFGPWSIDMYLPALPELTRDLHASAAAANLTLTASMAGLALGQVAGGPLTDARGRRRPLLAGLALFAAASAACALAPDVWTLVALRLVQGAAGGIGVVVARAVVRDLYEGVELARAFSILAVVFAVAPVVAPLAGGLVLRVASWHGVFVALTVLGALLCALSALVVHETLPRERRHRGGTRETLRALRRVARDRTFAPYCVAFSFGSGAIFAYIAASAFVLQSVYGLSAQAFSLVFAVNALAMVAAAQVGSRLVARTGPGPLFRSGLLGLLGAGGWLLGVALVYAPVEFAVGGFVALVSSAGLVMPNGTALALAEQGDRAGSASALLGLAQSSAAALVAPLVGLGGGRSVLPMAIAIGTCAAGAVAVDRVSRRGRHARISA